MMRNVLLVVVAISSLVAGSGCLFVREKDTNLPKETTAKPLPDLEMGTTMVRSKSGDMYCFLPSSWFLVDLGNQLQADVIAVAVNPDYTASVVFSVLRKSDQVDEVVAKEGVLGLARFAFAKQERKTAGAVKLHGAVEELSIGENRFGTYRFFGVDSSAISNSATFMTNQNTYYQVTVLPTSVSGREPMSTQEYLRVFTSILATVQY